MKLNLADLFVGRVSRVGLGGGRPTFVTLRPGYEDEDTFIEWTIGDRNPTEIAQEYLRFEVVRI